MSSGKLPLQELNQPQTPRDLTHSFSENQLRPKTFGDYVGQKIVAAQLELFVKAAASRSQVLDHVLLSGPPGLGKTTLAFIVAQELGGRLVQVPGPSIERSADLLSILTELKRGDVLFVDEIHRLNRVIEESLYPGMEDFRIQLVMGEGATAQSIPIELERFTLIGATTQPGKLSAPLRDRFGIQLNLDFYSVDEMEIILSRSARILGIELGQDEIRSIAQRSRGTPRIANRLLARVRDFVEVLRDQPLALSPRVRQAVQAGSKAGGGAARVEWALDFLEVDPLGLQNLDRKYLEALCGPFRGGPVGVEALAATLSEDRSTLEETIEPFLLKAALILRTGRGRVATPLAYSHLGLASVASAVSDSPDIGS
jgi:Holliday junction DNA helicase RuvB